MKKGWFDEQVSAMLSNINQVNERNPVVSAMDSSPRSPTAMRNWRSARQEFESGTDVDSVLDSLQLLDESGNPSIGAQVGNAVRHGPVEPNLPVRFVVLQ